MYDKPFNTYNGLKMWKNILKFTMIVVSYFDTSTQV